jgi:hypothetical protein
MYKQIDEVPVQNFIKLGDYIKQNPDAREDYKVHAEFLEVKEHTYYNYVRTALNKLRTRSLAIQLHKEQKL